MHIQIVNRITGEVVEANTICPVMGTRAKDSLVISSIRGVIRQWMSSGLSIHDFDILEWSTFAIYSHLRDYAWSQSFGKCDICEKVIKYDDMKFMTDYQDVCIVAGCHDCLGE